MVVVDDPTEDVVDAAKQRLQRLFDKRRQEDAERKARKRRQQADSADRAASADPTKQDPPGDGRKGLAAAAPDLAERAANRARSNPGHARRAEPPQEPPRSRRGHFAPTSNRRLVRNALVDSVLAGDGVRDRSIRERVLFALDVECEMFERFLIVFRDPLGCRHDFRALYAWSRTDIAQRAAELGAPRAPGRGGRFVRVFSVYPSPPEVTDEMLSKCFRYDSSTKEFRHIPNMKHLDNVTDAVCLLAQFLPKPKHRHPV